jgi:uncharacterized protein involved in exopolysaccharide biosynthesis
MKESNENALSDTTVKTGNNDAVMTAGDSSVAEQVGSSWDHSIGAIWDERRFITKWTIAGVVLGIVIALLVPKRYESTVTLMPPDNQGMKGLAALASLSGSAGPGLEAAGGDLLGVRSSGSLFIGVLRSRTAQEGVIAKLQLQKVYRAELVSDACQQLERNTAISEDRKSGILSITVSDHQSWRAAAIAQEYVSQLDHIITEASTSAAHREREFVEQRLNVVTKDLFSAEHDLSQFSTKSAILDVREQGRAMLETASQLLAQMGEARSTLSALQQLYTNDNIRVRTARARIAELQRELDRVAGTPSGSSATDAATPETYPSMRSLPVLGVQYADLYRRSMAQETLYGMLTKEYELAKIQEVKELPVVRVLDAPEIPQKKSGPRRAAIVITSAMLAFLFAAGFALAKWHWESADAGNPVKLLVQKVISDLNLKSSIPVTLFLRRPLFRRAVVRTPSDDKVPR